ncbi:hypothetical protein ACFWIN_02940 [Streptomyces sp. NPDC127049]|uniref:hypothetical protein n=1 Tax=Streptomyces sp. NPDC127049 TaxID=3347118 RepID=UPI0036626C0B
MAKSNPRQIMLDGRPMVVLTTKEYAALVAARRQAGGLAARLRVVGDTLRDTIDFLSALIAALESEAASGSGGRSGATGQPLPALLASAPNFLRHASGIVGGPRTPPSR